ncbi:hypothetical protein [Pseudoalteromonas peptidolytica]|uniref:Uncharacterized protein n=1 Tax=Pseudoalteromonas peptidolytica F12-50-A1 TaxID=1315280 RepID=A0A8I0MZ15_9GAMM|nr:hypothetical protein [Pseudoalteromonas peptidolytica]MBE0347846.1 hypothetical protein [Pseudoalteromonas peptidolytica F12-50-A1]NLR15246.1 hypothetical protein [Pseudoalteromonas peptidolytica]GEK10245.1 hypothetical protein PPE03_24940 [Pseudoalteromonas peptidolytica]
MLKIEGQYELNLEIGGVSLADSQGNLDIQEIEMIETVGTALPTISATLICRDKKVRALFHEGNRLNVMFRRNEDDSDGVVTSFQVTNVMVKRIASHYLIKFTGIYAAMSYLAEHRQRALKEKSAIEAITTIANTHFKKVDSNLAKSQDRQVWLQPNDTDKKFISDIWLHANLPDSMLMLAPCTNGDFRIRDLKTLVSKAQPNWAFLPNVKDNADDKNIWYSGEYTINTNSGFINHWLGYGNRVDITDRDLGEYEELLEMPTPKLTKSNLFPRRSDIDGRRGTPQWLNDNVHPKYWHAHQQNITSLALFSTVTVTLSYSDQLHPQMRVLDLVSFLEPDSTNAATDETHTGLYIISKLSRKFANNHIVTTVELSRETHEDIAGEIR